MSHKTIKIGVLGASGYTGADLIRLAVCHPHIEIVMLSAYTQAGQPVENVFPHLQGLNLPDLIHIDEADWSRVDVVFCGLPHGNTQLLAKDILHRYPHIKLIDMSADFRLHDPSVYAQWYGKPHQAGKLQSQAVYGLSEHYRDTIKTARLVACPGCYPTAVLMALLPLVRQHLIEPEDIIIDAKSGVSGAGRGLKQNTLFCEAGEGLSPYAIGQHRHAPEIEQELSKAAGKNICINFTPHLVPMSRGELCTHYVRCATGIKAANLRQELMSTYAKSPFVQVLDENSIPATQHVRGSNTVRIAVFEDRIAGRAILISTLDNLVKGSAGQALQNFNLMFDLPETTGLEQVTLFP